MSTLPVTEQFQRVGEALVPTGELVRPDGQALATELEANEVTAGEITLAQGAILIGAVSGKAAAQTPSGDVTINASGVTAIGATKVLEGMLANGSVTEDKIGTGAVTGAKIGNGEVTAAKLADGAGVAALLTAGLGSSAAVDHADSSPAELLAADPTNDRAVIVIAICTETLAGDNEPLFNAGWDADPDGLIDETLLAGATAGDVFFGAGNVPATNAINVTVADGGDPTNDAGAFAFTVLALPTA